MPDFHKPARQNMHTSSFVMSLWMISNGIETHLSVFMRTTLIKEDIATGMACCSMNFIAMFSPHIVSLIIRLSVCLEQSPLSNCRKIRYTGIKQLGGIYTEGFDFTNFWDDDEYALRRSGSGVGDTPISASPSATVPPPGTI